MKKALFLSFSFLLAYVLNISAQVQPNQFYFIKNKSSDKNAMSSSTVSLSNETGDNVKWEFIPSGGNFKIKNKRSGLFMMNSYGVVSAQATAELWAIEPLTNPVGYAHVKHIPSGQYLKTNGGALLVGAKLNEDFGYWKFMSPPAPVTLSNSQFISNQNTKYRSLRTSGGKADNICDKIQELTGNPSLMSQNGVDAASLTRIRQIVCENQPVQVNPGSLLTPAQKQIFDGFVEYFNQEAASQGLSGTFQQYFALWEQADLSQWSSLFDSYKAANNITDNTVKPKIQTWITRRSEVITALENYRNRYILPLNTHATTDLNSISTNLGMETASSPDENKVKLLAVKGLAGAISSVPIVGTAMSGLAAAAPLFLDMVLKAEYPSYTSSNNSLKISTAELVSQLALGKEFSLRMSEYMQYAILSDLPTMMNTATSTMVTQYNQAQANSQLDNAVNQKRTVVQKELWKALLPARALIVSEFRSKKDYPELYTGNTNLASCAIPGFSADEDYVAYSKYHFNLQLVGRNDFVFKWALRVGSADQNTTIGNANGLGYANLFQHFPNMSEIFGMLYVYHKPLFADTGLKPAATTARSMEEIWWIRDIVIHYEKLKSIEKAEIIDKYFNVPGIGTPGVQLYVYFKPDCYAYRNASLVNQSSGVDTPKDLPTSKPDDIYDKSEEFIFLWVQDNTKVLGEDNGHLVLRDAADFQGETFKLEKQNGFAADTYRIKHVRTGNYLTVEGGEFKKGTHVTVGGAEINKNQRYAFMPSASAYGAWDVKSKLGTAVMALEPDGPNAYNWVRIEIGNGQKGQGFKLIAISNIHI